jgi:hypothetical protein
MTEGALTALQDSSAQCSMQCRGDTCCALGSQVSPKAAPIILIIWPLSAAAGYSQFSAIRGPHEPIGGRHASPLVSARLGSSSPSPRRFPTAPETQPPDLQAASNGAA